MAPRDSRRTYDPPQSAATPQGRADSGEIDLVAPDLDPRELEAFESELKQTGFRAVVTRVNRYLARPRWWVEVLLLGALYAVYSVIRNSVGEVADQAYRNAYEILRIEDAWHFALERPLNELVHTTSWLANIVALQYATLHFLVTPAVLIWLLFRRKDHYRKVSGTLVLCTGLALFGFYFMPTAPPRLLPGEGFVDVMAQTSSWGWWPESGAPGSDAISNQFAAMPSLHCAWATWCGLVLFFLAKWQWLRILGLIYPFTTYFVVMGSGNHFILDVIAGVALLAVAAAIVYAPTLLRWWRGRSADAPAGAGVPIG
ncbi:phosphatase PAP2 family protein [Williamsia soli]|uniref:phosphatase PAP2 family protein n=1 Tax=Williamsia soli TaxID=364929 RepID=UPI001A9FDEE5|nr:phosphatase PAP2 family protein [Williamsia soli]